MNFTADNPDHLQSNSTGLSTKNHTQRPTATLSGLVVDKLTRGQVFLQVLWFVFPKCSTPILIHLTLKLYNQLTVLFNTSLQKDAYYAGTKIFNRLLI
jgi:hypothetical protein